MMRVKASAIAERLGITARTVANLAANGSLPSAAKIGKVWTFDPARIEQFIREQEAATEASAWVKRTCSGGAKSGGFELPSGDEKSAKAFERGISRLLGASATGGSTKSHRRRGTGKRK